MIAAILWAIVILIVAITPGNEISKVNQSFFTAKLAHFGEFLIFGWLLGKSFPDLKNPLLLALFWAAFTESLQLFVPGRSFEYSDIVLNGAGGVIGISLKNISLKHKLRV
ncbi:VanZ like family protein [uncultured archaeon]|nr:VanZ like family protein [uncultured archaeon]